MKTRIVTFGLGGADDQKPNGNVVSDVVAVTAGLGADRLTLPADGATVATCHYLAADSTEVTASWVVNGQAYSEPLVDGASEIEVTAAAAGALEISCNGHSLTIEVI